MRTYIVTLVAILSLASTALAQQVLPNPYRNSKRVAVNTVCVVDNTSIKFQSVFNVNYTLAKKGIAYPTVSAQYFYSITCKRPSSDSKWTCTGAFADVTSLEKGQRVVPSAIAAKTIVVAVAAGNVAIINIGQDKQLVVDSRDDQNHFTFVETNATFYGRSENSCQPINHD